MKKTYFVSDLHFGLLAKDVEDKREKHFVNFLYSIKDDASTLYILGDLFDYWFEYNKVVQKGFYRTFTALRDLVEAGVKVKYYIGNHDFMHKDFFEKEIGLELIQTHTEDEIDGVRFFLGHGDGLVKNDTGYKILKKILRNKFIQKLYSIIHPDLGIWLASSTSKQSRTYTEKKNYGQLDGLFETAKEKIDDGFQYVIFGHAHIRKFEKYKDGHYINLGTWLDRPCYGVFQNKQFDIIDWE